MATELIKKEVDGLEYQFEQFGAKQSLKILMKLSKMVGRPFIASIGSYQGKGQPLNVTALTEAASLLFQSLDETETISLIELLTAEKCWCAGVKIKFDTHYEGKLTHLFKVLNAALEVQYGNFFEELAAFLNSKSDKADTLQVK